MPFDPCNPCGCIPANIDDRLFHQMATNLLCGILEAVQGGGGVAENVNVSAWGGVATSLGQKVMASSVPVVIASDQSAVPISGTVTVGNGAGAAAVNIQDGGNTITVDGTVTQTPAVAGTATVSVSTTSAAASTTAGIRALSIANVGGASGTVDGDAFEAGATLSLSAIFDPVTNTYLKVPAIAYSAVGTTFRIVEIA